MLCAAIHVQHLSVHVVPEQASVSSSGQVQVSPATGAADTAAITQQLPYQDVQVWASSAAAANDSSVLGDWMVSVQNGPPVSQTLRYLLR